MNHYAFQYCQKLIIFSADGTQTLLCKRQGEADYDGTFTFIGGKMETTDASIANGLKREKIEEIGAQAKIRVALGYTTNVLFRKKDGNSMIIPHYYAEYIDGPIELSDEYSEYKWVDLADLPKFEPKIANIPEMINKMARLRPLLAPADFTVI